MYTTEKRGYNELNENSKEMRANRSEMQNENKFQYIVDVHGVFRDPQLRDRALPLIVSLNMF